MSISSALNSAITGLTASARAADVSSSNIANVLTEGYAPRLLELETMGQGLPGVVVTGVVRRVDPVLLADRRLADGALANADTRATFLSRIAQSFGTPDDPASIPAKLAAFEAGLVFASNNPENSNALRDVSARATELATRFNAVSDDIQRLRGQAETQIAAAVDEVNTLLNDIRELNIDITAHGGKDHLAASQFDQRQAMIDELSELIPVRQVARDNNAVALITPGGAILLDGTAATLDFTASNVVAPHMTLANGLLSGLTINGVDVAPSGPTSPIEGGRLAALFAVRDDLAVEAQTQIDALARNLLERFQDPALDATRAPGDPGLFTDGGVLFDPVNEIGVAGRLAINPLVDPDQGGAVWRLRDGLGAAAEGPAGNGTLLSALSGALSNGIAMGSGDLGATPRALTGHLATYTSQLGHDRLTLDRAVSFASARQDALVNFELENGVDTDAELQRLLLVEQAYGANARMIQTLDEMMQQLLRI